ncbi:hypothetical protein H6G64_36395 [Calothrix sp. FACHB-156]|nr:hypothetical protein [Calothrix sp. FACHB-156]
MSQESSISNPASNPQAEEPQLPEKPVPSIFATAPTARYLTNLVLVPSVVRRVLIQPVTETTPPPAMEAMVASVGKSTPQRAKKLTISSPKNNPQAEKPQPPEKPSAEGSIQKIRRGSIWA